MTRAGLNDTTGRRIGPSRGLRGAALVLGLGIPILLTDTLYRQRVQDLAEAEQRAVNTARTLAQHAERTFETIDTYLRAVGSLAGPRAGEMRPEMVHAALHEQFTHARGLVNIMIIDRDGRALVDADAFPARALDVRDRDYFQALRDRPGGGLVVGHPITGRLTGKLLLPVARRIDGPDGAFAGVVQALIDPDVFRAVYEAIDNGPGAAVSLWRADGTLLARAPWVPEMIGRNYAAGPNYKLHVPIRDDKPFWSLAITDGIERVFAFGFLGDYPVYVSAAVARADALSEWYRSALTQAGTGGGLTLVLVAALLLLAREIERRHGADARIRADEARLRALTDALPQMVWMTGRDADETLYRNAQFEAYYGPISPTLGARQAANHPDDAAHMAEVRRDTIGQGRAFSMEGRLRRHDGIYR